MFVLHCEYLNDILIYYFCLNIHTPQICSKVLLFSQIGKSFLTNPHFFLILDIFPLSGKYISVNCLCVIVWCLTKLPVLIMQRKSCAICNRSKGFYM